MKSPMKSKLITKHQQASKAGANQAALISALTPPKSSHNPGKMKYNSSRKSGY